MSTPRLQDNKNLYIKSYKRKKKKKKKTIYKKKGGEGEKPTPPPTLYSHNIVYVDRTPHPGRM